MSSHKDRLAALRDAARRDRLDGFVVPLTDEHMSEYVGSYAQRLHWLTGFQGSAGSAAVLPQEAAIFTDGRYTIQVRQQVSADEWSYQSVPQTSISEWLASMRPTGRGSAMTRGSTAATGSRRRRRRCQAKGAELVAVGKIRSTGCGPTGRRRRMRGWSVQPEALAGKSSAEKRARRRRLAGREKGRRGGAGGARFDRLDVQRARRRRVAYAGRAGLCGGPCRRHGGSVRGGGEGRRRGRASISAMASGCTSARRSSRTRGLERQAHCGRSRAVGGGDHAGARAGGGDDPRRARSRRAGQGDQEPGRDRRAPGGAGARRGGDRQVPALGRGGRCLGRDRRDRRGRISRRCARRRARSRTCRSTRFPRSGPNGALPHYGGTANRPLANRHALSRRFRAANIRTARPTSRARCRSASRPTEMRDRFTRVLRGHIAIATASVPEGHARAASSTASRAGRCGKPGCDYAHGTGHGVGAFLSVHEGPQRISPVGSARRAGDEPLRRG